MPISSTAVRQEITQSSRLVLGLMALALAPSHLLQAQNVAAQRTPTCLQGLRTYKMPGDVPAPYDSVMPPTPRGTTVVSGLRQITSVEAFTKELLQGAAELGATGYITFTGEGGESRENIQYLSRVLPVFVAADSARALATCRARGNEPPRPA